ncbi:magnesium transporter CorA family protein [Sphingomonas montanisoli]|uniref:Magnesium transporter CorA family protein n=1 Tax=Sphingomonas montanisoli TaxID=2606412 RepID=A0A5D9C447_9SPHN|nr:CorA family divalent cation transporter [Sphingomonas montanisoli]TZG25760.1 hypothetical protein FYJ91_12240 [Sphingomonas montanisoli]
MSIDAYLYCASGHDRKADLAATEIGALGDDELLWINVEGCDGEDAVRIGELLGIDPELLSRLCGPHPARHLDNFGDHYAFAVETPRRQRKRGAGDARDAGQGETGQSDAEEITQDAIGGLDLGDDSEAPKSAQLGFVVGKRWLVTVHTEPVEFLQGFRKQDKGETRIGSLSPSLLVASLLDWHLSEFLHAVSVIERDADRLDEKILADGTRSGVLGDVVALRRRVSQLRLMIARQRPVFHGLSRPDFALNADERAAGHFATLADRFDRAVDEVERSRDVALGSFDLFTSMTTQQTNELVKALTFLTALIGACAAVAGLLGMNFEMPFFKTGAIGFIGVTIGMVVASGVAMFWARHRRWI